MTIDLTEKSETNTRESTENTAEAKLFTTTKHSMGTTSQHYPSNASRKNVNNPKVPKFTIDIPEIREKNKEDILKTTRAKIYTSNIQIPSSASWSELKERRSPVFLS